MRTLNEITQDIAKFEDALRECEGDVAKAASMLVMTEEEFLAAYDAIMFEDATKLDAYIFKIEESKSREAAAQSMADQWQARADDYKAKVKAEEKAQAFMKARLKFNMDAKKETKIVTADGRTISIQKNSTTPTIIDEDVLNALPREELEMMERAGLLVLEPMLDRAKITEVLKKGEVLKFAKLGERGTHLRIK